MIRRKQETFEGEIGETWEEIFQKVLPKLKNYPPSKVEGIEFNSDIVRVHVIEEVMKDE